MQDKIISYIGFAVKARKVKTGVNAVDTVKKGVYLLVLCASAALNTQKEALSFSKRFNCKIVVSKTYLLEDVVHKENCKLIAITDRQFANAILNNLNEHFVILEA